MDAIAAQAAGAEACGSPAGGVTAQVIEVDSRWLAFLGGRKAFRDGLPKPIDEWTDDQWMGRCCDGQCRLLGWMLERAMVLMTQDRVRAWAEEGEPL